MNSTVAIIDLHSKPSVLSNYLKKFTRNSDFYDESNIEQLHNKAYEYIYLIPNISSSSINNEELQLHIGSMQNDIIKRFVMFSSTSVYDTTITSPNCNFIEWNHDPFEEHIASYDPQINALHALELWVYSKFYDQSHIIRLSPHITTLDATCDNNLTGNANTNSQITSLEDLWLDTQTICQNNIRLVNVISDVLSASNMNTNKKIYTKHGYVEDYPFFYYEDYINEVISIHDAIRVANNVSNLVVSNLAWDVSWEDFALSCLERVGIKHLEISITKYIPWNSVDGPNEARALKQRFEARGFSIYSIQSMFFSKEHNLFTNPDAFINHFTKVIGLASILGASRVNFGSGMNRGISCTLDQSYSVIEASHQKFITVMRALANYANKHYIQIGIEPIPSKYSCSYLNNLIEVAAMVNVINHPNIELTYDTGNAETEGSDPIREVQSLENVGHFQIGEQGMKPLHDFDRHKQIAQSIKDLNTNPNTKISLEMLDTTPTQFWHSVRMFVAAYG